MIAHCTDPFCGCHAEMPRVPFDVFNRPGLSTLATRIGTFSSFRQTMLEAIAKAPALSQLTSREPEDYAISLIEMFAAMGDVLTFYGERFANEYYLGTATGRASVQRLVRLIGHELSPGLAATALLAFEIEAGARVRLRKGLPVMSIPGQDEVPQTYETLGELMAHADLNAPRGFAPPVALDAFAAGRTQFTLATRPEKLTTGDALAIFDGIRFEEKRVEAIEEQWGGLALRFTPPMQTTGLAADRTQVRRLERRLALFGIGAPQTVQLYSTASNLDPSQRWTTKTVNDQVIPEAEWFYPLEIQLRDLSQGVPVLIDSGEAGAGRFIAATIDTTRDAVAKIETTDHVDVPLLAQTTTYIHFARMPAGRPAMAAGGGGAQIVCRDAVNALLAASDGQVIRDLATTGDGSLVATGGGAVRLFVRDNLQALRDTSRPGGGDWSTPLNHGGVLTGDPAGLALGNGEVLAFGRGRDLGLWVIGVGASPHPWLSLGGIITSAPAVASCGGARVDVFARGADRALWQISRDGVWSNWVELKGILGSAPAAVSAAMDRLDVVARSDAGALLHRRWNGAVWSDWLDLGGDVAGTPAIVATGSDQVAIVVRRSDGALGVIERSAGGWSSWLRIEARFASDPAAAVAGGALHVAARTSEDVLVEAVRQAGGAWGPWTRRDVAVTRNFDRRKTRILQIGSERISPRAFDYPGEVSGGQLAIQAAPGMAELGKGRLILIEATAMRHLATVTAATPLAAIPGEMTDHVLLGFAPPLPRPVSAAIVRANIANSSHGETQPDEPLGHGDASKSFAEFTLQRAPLTFLPAAGQITGLADLEVRVNGVSWSPVPSLFGRKPTEEVYTLRADDDGTTTIGFGDGRTGRRLPTGPLAVVARYRKGIGLGGRVRAGQLALPLERPVGLRSVSNPMASVGGADPENRAAARETVPNQIRTFGRAVSLDDFAWLAKSTRLAARAVVTWVWLRLGKQVHLSVLGAGGERLSADELRQLMAALAAARNPNLPLTLSNITRVPLTISARVLCDPRFERDTVMANARSALNASFAFEAVEPGMPVHASAVYASLQQVEGVIAADVDVFQLKGFADLTAAERQLRAVDTGPLQQHVRLFLARALPADPALIDRFARAGFDNGVIPPVLPAEQAFIEEPSDIALTPVEAL